VIRAVQQQASLRVPRSHLDAACRLRHHTPAIILRLPRRPTCHRESLTASARDQHTAQTTRNTRGPRTDPPWSLADLECPVSGAFIN